MKIISDKWQVTSDTNRQPVRCESVFSCHPSPVTRQSQRGVALIITLLLLSVALVMALAFLAISGREQGSVTTQTDTATTRLAADAGLAAAEAQIAANILSTTNPYSFGLLVSTNYLPLTNGNPLLDLTNLQYSPRAPVLISTNERTGRFYLDLNRNGRDDPNGVMPATNNAGQEILDANNNPVIVNNIGDPEWIGVLEHPDQPYGPQNPFIARFAYIALPVGNSLDLNAIHNQVFDELFVGFSSGSPVPVNPPPSGSGNDMFFRNQGVGSWELNLAAFLADLNTNQWGQIVGSGVNPPAGSQNWYQYTQPNPTPPGAFPNKGAAFDDARALLSYRYATNYMTLQSVDNLFGGPFPTGAGDIAFRSDNIDGYSDRPLQTTFDTNEDFVIVNNDNPKLPWAGADNTNRFFDPTADLFDLSKIARHISPTVNFSNRLRSAGNGFSTYNRYTFYRMLSQLGTDTAPESGKMNLNYDNLDPGSNGVLTVTGAASATNFVPWQPLAFFTNAADRLLHAYTAQWATTYLPNESGVLTNGLNTNFVATFNITAPFGVTRIPVLVSNQFVYTPAVNRLLQLAANMYDATTTNMYPDIFRPIFNVVVENGYADVYIIGYTNQTTLIDHNFQMTVGANNGVLDPPVEVTTLPLGTNMANVYGVPLIIGAKKGLPNFNAFSVESAFQLVRKLEVQRDTNATPQPHITWTNQMYLMNITNYMGLSCWNSYFTNYAGPVDIVVRCGSSIMVTNDNNLNPPYTFGTNFAFATEFSPWPGWGGVPIPKQQSASFVVPLSASVLTLTNAMYYYNGSYPANSAELRYYLGDSPSNYLDKGIRPLPHFGLLMTNRLQVAIIDYSTNVSSLNGSGPTVGRIVDYVQLGGMDSSQDLTSAIQANDPYHFFDMTYTNGFLLGVLNQILMSKYGSVNGVTPTGAGAWTTAQIPGGPTGAATADPVAQQAFFRGFFNAKGTYSYGRQNYVNSQSDMQAPYTPMAYFIQHTTWGANDPLVHYLSSDLAAHTENLTTANWDPNNLRVTNDRYQPWGSPRPTYDSGNGIDQNPNNLSFKDPLVRGSDNWDFPAGKLPTVGWLGRVHRGTPWQTVYLKAADILAETNASNKSLGVNTWINWTGDGNLFDMTNSAPVQDRLLFDLFTTAFNDNATRGQLSVNQSADSYDATNNPAAGLAAWSAVFSGIEVFSNNLLNSIVSSTNHYQKPLPAPWENPPVYTNLIINPAGVDANNSALAQIVAGIDRTRATFTNADGLVGAFERKGDILTVPQLAEQSPFLNWNNPAQQTNGISDEMYEWLPQQMLSLVRDSVSPRYVIYSYGQALKPAPNGIYLGATPAGIFGMVTNYQVVSEIATRAVMRLDTVRTNVAGNIRTITVTPPRAVIESFNILPPN